MRQRLAGITLVLALVSAGVLFAAPKAELWPRWEAHDPASTVVVDHSGYGEILQEYLTVDDPSGVNFFGYAQVTEADKASLDSYVDTLAGTAVSALNRQEQKALWINLYNAVTLKVVLEHYPVKSIRDIKLSRGLRNSGPWDAALIEVEGEEMSLNDIEHRILRPIWMDNRIHYAVNCASMSCPNLHIEPYTAANTDSILDEAASNYVNHRRGVSFDGGKLVVSSIYSWYADDFGGNDRSVLDHLAEYAVPDLAARLGTYTGKIRDDYDWSLNER
jgi:hypothetical protein